MAISTVGSVLGPSFDTTTSKTVVYTLGMGETVTAGNLAVIIVGAAGNVNLVVSSVTDTQGNTYLIGPCASPASGAAVSANIAYSTLSRGLSAGDVITATLNLNGNSKAILVRELTGHDTSTPLDLSVSNVLAAPGSATPAATSSPVASAVASEYAVSVVSVNGSGTLTDDAAWTNVWKGHYDNGGASVFKQLGVAEKILSSTGVQHRTDSLSPANSWAMVLATFKAATSSAPSSTKVAPQGLFWPFATASTPTTAYAGAFSGRTFYLTWGPPGGLNALNSAALQPADGGALDPTQLAIIDAALDAAHAAGDQVAFRIFCGTYVPSWLAAKVGTVKHKNGQNPTPVLNMVRFWETAYMDAWDDFMNKLGTRYDGGGSPSTRQATVRVIAAAPCMWQYAEPLIRDLNLNANNGELVGGTGWTGAASNGTGGAGVPVPGAGWSFAKDFAAQKRAIDIHNTRWPNTCMSIAFNPYQVLYSSDEAVTRGHAAYTTNGTSWLKYPADESGLKNTKALIDYMISVLGPTNRIVLENNSIRYKPYTSANPAATHFLATTLSAAVTLPKATIGVVANTDLSAMPSSGTFVIATPAGGQTITYTGKTANSFTGCTGGAGSFPAGTTVIMLNAAITYGQLYTYMLGKPYAKWWQQADPAQQGDYPTSMLGTVYCLAGNAAEPTSNTGSSPFTVAEQTAWDTALRAVTLPAGGSTAHIPSNLSVPTIDVPSGGYTPASVLTAHLGSWDAGTHALTSLHIQWYRKNPSTNTVTSVQGPTAKSGVGDTDAYTLVNGDLNNVIYCTVTATNADGTSSPVASLQTPVVVTPVNPPPVCTVVPVADTSQPVSGDLITWTPGTWTNTPTSYTHAISRSLDGSAWTLVQSGSSPSYQTADADIGYEFKDDVTANNGLDSVAPGTSLATAAVVGVPVITLDASTATLPTDISTYTFTGNVQPRGTGVTISAFTVNGTPVTLSPDGSFSVVVTVAVGTNIYTFVATDSAGDSSSANATIYRTDTQTSADVNEIEVRIHQRGLANQ